VEVVQSFPLLVEFRSEQELWRVAVEDEAMVAPRASERPIDGGAVERVEVPVRSALVTISQISAL
jgi:hypothetical protein